MGNEYIQYPTSVKSLAGEIKAVCDDYDKRKINNDRIKEIILWYANTQSDKLFDNEKFNPTVSKIIGKKRVRLISDLLKTENARV